MNEFFRKLGWLARRRQKEDDLREELQFHLAEEAERLQSDGLPERQANFAARGDLGSLALLSENTRAAWGWTFLEQLGQDLRYAFRMMSANRLFTALAVLSLALGIGANTAIYSFMDAILLRALPVSDPDRWWFSTGTPSRVRRDLPVMHSMATAAPGTNQLRRIERHFSLPGLRAFPEEQTAVFASVFAYFRRGRRASEPRRSTGKPICRAANMFQASYFRGLGVPPAAGRLIAADDDRAAAPAVAVAQLHAQPAAFRTARPRPWANPF